ncbi:MAG: hypothetical protein ABSF69_25770 [Polyangiaceae bacterium]
MRRKSASHAARVAVAAALWACAALLVQTTAGIGIGVAARRLEQRLELQLKRAPIGPIEPRPLKRIPEDLMAPWELVSV